MKTQHIFKDTKDVSKAFQVKISLVTGSLEDQYGHHLKYFLIRSKVVRVLGYNSTQCFSPGQQAVVEAFVKEPKI